MRIVRAVACLLFLTFIGAEAYAAPQLDVLKVDLDPLIDAAFRVKEQFAVRVPHGINSDRQGVWSSHQGVSTWQYNTRIPSAVSMSFHASVTALPPSAVLAVKSGQTTLRYTAHDVGKRGLWVRPMLGDTLSLTLTVHSDEAARVKFQIESLQAGYRSLGSAAPNHPHYQALIKASASSGCTENYACHVSADNHNASHATVAVIIGNQWQCTGTLLNNTQGSGQPYVLTARHCENGALGGGDPSADATVSIYWDTVTPCGSTLASLYSSAAVSQTGATTVLEQQDLWLLQLDTPAAATDAYFAGWDVSGATFIGGYTIHDALGLDQQYVAWSGMDDLEHISGATLGIAYDSTFWGVVNGVGSIGAGGSGSALFNPSNQVVGSASLAALTSGAGSAGVCPVNPPAAPSPNTATALFTSLSAAWTSTADRTSSTGNKTLQALLDPTATGQTSLAGLASIPITFTTSSADPNTGESITLTWSATGASSCTAWGGASGDGWAGTKPASGSMQVLNQKGGVVYYSLSCLVGNQIGSGYLSVNWYYVQPMTGLTGSLAAALTLGASSQINWFANVSPCVGSGGNPGDGWAGAQPDTGTFVYTATQLGVTTYTLTCGTSERSQTDSVYVDVVPPHVVIYSDTPNALVSEPFNVGFHMDGSGGSCTTTGGSGTDGWAVGNAGYNGGGTLNETTPGAYTFTVTCSGGGQTVSSSTMVTVSAGSPSSTLTAAAPTQQVSGTYFGNNLFWTNTGIGCAVDYTTNSGSGQAVVLSGEGPVGAFADYENSPGLVTYSLECPNASPVTATINWVTDAPATTVSVTQGTWASHVAYPVSWKSDQSPCTAGGGSAGDGWAGTKASSGSQMVSEPSQGAYLFTLTCGTGANAVTAGTAVVIQFPFVQIYSTPASDPVTGLPETQITWASSTGPCTYFDGTAPGTTGVAVASSATVLPTASVAGTYLFKISCGTGANTLSQSLLAFIPVDAPTTLTASTTHTEVDGPVTLTWNSDGGICYASGGDGGSPWVGTLGGAGSGSVVVTSKSTGVITYGVNCNSEVALVSVTYTAVPPNSGDASTPSVTLTSSASTDTAGQSINLNWSAKNASSCSASGGTAGDGWTGALANSGSMSITEADTGTVTYSITCTGAPPAATASTTVVVVKSQPTSSSSSASSHGGGAMDAWMLLILSLPFANRFLRRKRY